jgi:hypothetical protein
MRNILRHRSYLRHLTPNQRRSWFEQWKVLRPRVKIGSSYVPYSVQRSFAYIKQG